ncbi:sigma 54-interacting transcriptional regulator [candidate division KSB1 bacterium]|nr:sigma 54-interacting transcriptional regulator [candidate division KSB1 bacterium]
MENQILDLAKRVLAETEVHSVIDRAMDQLIQLSGAERGMIILFDQKGGPLFETARNLKKEDIEKPMFEVSRTIIDAVKTDGKPICLPNALDEPSMKKSKSTIRLNILSVICLPLKHNRDIFGVIYLDNRTVRGMFSPQIFELIESFADFISLSAYHALEKQHRDQHIAVLESELRSKYKFDAIISHEPKMIEILKIVSQIANSEATVIIQGESGTGKELIARSIHYNSSRRDKAFVPINCGALPENLLESELFGHIKGAFTGAVSNKAGWFETANGGTIFLDEVSEMTPALQVKFIRVLQTGEYSRVGSREIRHVDVRVITATNQNLKELINEGKFRKDLYYRLNVIEIDLPPLRERKCDIPILAKHFINVYCEKYKKSQMHLSHDAETCLLTYDFPGNIRELENAVQRAVALSEGDTIVPDLLPANLYKNQSITGKASQFSTLTEAKRQAAEQAEREFVKDCLRATNGRIRKAAKMAGIDASNFHKIMKKHEINTAALKT